MSLSNSHHLSEDKILQAALDSACNRSCAGTLWISHTKAALEKAPNYIKELIQRVPEHERLRFGNGGQLVSRERVRLPFVVAGKVILVWVSSVPCASLGLLLGKDALDALGSLLDFMGNRIQFQLLSPQKWIPLHKLSAGHFAIPCLPTPLTRWPSLSSQPWVRVGKGSCCEVQVESKQQWILKKLRTTFSQSCTSEPESQVVEHFVSASFLDLSLEALGDHASRATEMAASRQSAAAFASGLSLESHVHPPCSPSSMALARPAPVADSTALFEVCAVSSSFSDDGAGMASAGGFHGGTRFMASSMASPHQHRDTMHSRAFEEATHLRDRLGLRLSFLEDEMIMFGLKALQKNRSEKQRQWRPRDCSAWASRSAQCSYAPCWGQKEACRGSRKNCRRLLLCSIHPCLRRPPWTRFGSCCSPLSKT